MFVSGDQAAAKAAAAHHAAANEIEPGMAIGLGSGSTAIVFVEALGRAIADGLRIRGGIATSAATERAALAAGVPLITFEDVMAADGPDGRLDVTVDGADEIDADWRLIKGGGASLLREKIVARFSRRMVMIADASKRVDRVGAFPLPVEVVPFGVAATRALVGAALADSLGRPVTVTLRARDGSPVLTDNGNHLLDCATGPMEAPEAVADALADIAGVVEHGLFLTEADAFVLGRPDGTVELGERGEPGGR